MRPSGIERREFLTALTVGLLNACGGRPEQTPAPGPTEVLPARPTPEPQTEAIRGFVEKPRLRLWRRNLPPEVSVRIIDHQKAQKGEIISNVGLRTRYYPGLTGEVAPQQDWLEWGAEVEYQVEIEIVTPLGNNLFRRERWPAITAKKSPGRARIPVEDLLFAARDVNTIDQQGNLRGAYDNDWFIGTLTHAPSYP